MTKLEKAEKELSDFLKKHPQPHRQQQQKEIEELLNKTPNDKRLEVVLMMLVQKSNELLNQTLKLKTYH